MIIWWWKRIRIKYSLLFKYSRIPTAYALVSNQHQTNLVENSRGLSKQDSRDKGIRGALAAPHQLI